MKDHYCSVCEKTENGDYCSACGQKIAPTRTTLISLIYDLLYSAIDIEKSVFSCLFALMINPKKIIVNYWDGYRKYYPSPGKFLLYTVAVAALHVNYIDPYIMGVSFTIPLIDSEITFWILILPLISLTTYLTYIQSNRNLTKHLVANIYIGTSIFIILTALSDLLILTTDLNFGASLLPLFLVLVFIWNARLNSQKGGVYILFGTFVQFLVFLSFIAIIVCTLVFIFPDAISVE